MKIRDMRLREKILQTVVLRNKKDSFSDEKVGAVFFGGEIITVGSDGHKPEHLAYDFHKVPSILKEAGFHYYTIFKNRKPEFIKL